MSAKLPAKSKVRSSNEPAPLVAMDPSLQPGKLKPIGGSMSDDWNNRIANETIAALWVANADPVAKERMYNAAVAALIGINPTDELEGMMAAQLIASHAAAMECYRRAMIREQTFEGRSEALSQANRLSRTHAALLETFNRHRGKGQQKVTVEHVHVHSGGQAIVGNVNRPGGGDQPKPEDQPDAKQITHAPEPPLRSADTAREPVPVASDAERSLPDARGAVPRCAEG